MSRPHDPIDRARPARRWRWLLAVGFLVLPIDRARGGTLVPPPLLPFEWANESRTLDIQFKAANGYQSPDTMQVPGAGGNFTFGDAVRQAATAWNNANTGWTLNVIPPGKRNPADPLITVVFDNLTPNVVPHLPTDTDLLAVFRNRNPENQPATAEIAFNAKADWGTTGALTFDPIILALHELGHAIRLGHEPVGNSPNGKGTVTLQTLNDDSIMEPVFSPGVHQFNPSPGNKNTPAGFTIYPNAVDIKAAKHSAAAKGILTPEPAAIISMSIGVLGILVSLGRGRRGFDFAPVRS